MANLGQDFDANTVEPAAPRELLPADKYPAQAVKSDIVPTKAGNGKIAVIEWDIIDGQFKGRKLWSRINIINASVQAQEIGQRELSAICHATGQLKVSDTEQLHFKPVLLTVAVKAAEGNYGPSNEIKGYEALPVGYRPPADTSHAATPASAQARVPAAAVSGGNTPPWRR